MNPTAPRWVRFGLVALGLSLAVISGTGTARAMFSHAPAPSTYTVSAAAVDHLVVSPSSATITAGGSQSYTVTALDASNNSFGDVTASTTFTITPDGSCVAASCTATTAGPHTVTAVFWGVTGTATLQVNASTLDHFSLVLASPQAVGATFTGTNTLRAQDAFGNNVTTFNAATDNVTITANAPLTSNGVSFTTGATANVLNAAPDFVNGVADLTALGMKYTGVAGTASFTATSASGKAGSSSAVTVTAGAATRFSVTAQTITPAAGAADNLTITALDAVGNVATSYTGDKTTIRFTGASTIGANTPTVTNKAGAPVNFGTNQTLTFLNGVASPTTTGASGQAVMKLYKAETLTLTVTDGTITNSPGLSVTVSASTTGGALSFVNCSINGATPGPCTGTQALGNNVSVTFNIAATDTYGNPYTAGVSVSLAKGGTTPTRFDVTGPADIAAGASQSATVTVTHNRNNANDTATVTASASGFAAASLDVKGA